MGISTFLSRRCVFSGLTTIKPGCDSRRQGSNSKFSHRRFTTSPRRNPVNRPDKHHQPHIALSMTKDSLEFFFRQVAAAFTLYFFLVFYPHPHVADQASISLH